MNELQAVHTFWFTLTVQCSASHKRTDVVHEMFHLRTLTNKHSAGNGGWFHSTRIIMNSLLVNIWHLTICRPGATAEKVVGLINIHNYVCKNKTAGT